MICSGRNRSNLPAATFLTLSAEAPTAPCVFCCTELVCGWLLRRARSLRRRVGIGRVEKRRTQFLFVAFCLLSTVLPINMSAQQRNLLPQALGWAPGTSLIGNFGTTDQRFTRLPMDGTPEPHNPGPGAYAPKTYSSVGKVGNLQHVGVRLERFRWIAGPTIPISRLSGAPREPGLPEKTSIIRKGPDHENGLSI